MKKRVAIVDDHTLVAEALSKIVNQFVNFRVLYHAHNGKELQDKMQQPENVPDVVMLDINMPIMDGFETTDWLRLHHSKVFILVLTVNDDEGPLIKIIKKGAHGYLLKNVRAMDLEQALEMVVERGYYYSNWVAHTMRNSLTAENDDVSSQLNEMELEFLGHIPSELTYKEIADRMCKSPRTVEGYRDSLFDKFGVKSRVGLLVYALKNKLISL